MKNIQSWARTGSVVGMLFALIIGWLGFGGMLGLKHGSCCRITPAVHEDLEPLFSAGAVDFDKAAVALGRAAWVEGSGSGLENGRKEFEKDIQFTVGHRASMGAVDRWRSDLRSAYNLAFVAAGGLMLQGVWLAAIGRAVHPARMTMKT